MIKEISRGLDLARSLAGAVSCFFTLLFQLQLPDIFLVPGAAQGLLVHDEVIEADERNFNVTKLSSSLCCKYLSESRQTGYLW